MSEAKRLADMLIGLTVLNTFEVRKPLLRESAAILRLQEAEIERLRKDAGRLRIRGAAYEEAYGIAHRATYQSHNGHWDKTMQGGRGCPECIRAQEARDNCDAALRRGLDGLIDAAMKEKP